MVFGQFGGAALGRFATHCATTVPHRLRILPGPSFSSSVLLYPSKNLPSAHFQKSSCFALGGGGTIFIIFGAFWGGPSGVLFSVPDPILIKKTYTFGPWRGFPGFLFFFKIVDFWGCFGVQEEKSSKFNIFWARPGCLIF